jgi:hypothetical protein
MKVPPCSRRYMEKHEIIKTCSCLHRLTFKLQGIKGLLTTIVTCYSLKWTPFITPSISGIDLPPMLSLKKEKKLFYFSRPFSAEASDGSSSSRPCLSVCLSVCLPICCSLRRRPRRRRPCYRRPTPLPLTPAPSHISYLQICARVRESRKKKEQH